MSTEKEPTPRTQIQMGEQRCAQYDIGLLNLLLNPRCVSSEEIELTSEHISMLKKCIPKFREANPIHREEIVRDAADRIKETWSESIEFDEVAAICVCDPLAGLGYSEIFSSLFESTSTATLNGGQRNPHSRPENGHT